MKRRTARVAAWVARLGVPLAALASCDEAPKATPAITSASAAATPPVRLRVEPYGSVVFTRSNAPDGGASATTKGLVTAVSGTLTVTPEDLKSLRGTIVVDLAKLTTHSFADEARDAKETAAVRDALEASKEPFKLARFTIKDLVEPVDDDVFKLPSYPPTVTLRITGDLELHGAKVEQKVELSGTFTVREGKLQRLTLTTPSPIPVKLADFGIAGATVKPGDEALVTLEIGAVVAP